MKAKRELLLLHIARQPTADLGYETRGLIFLNQGSSLQQRSTQVPSQAYLRAQGFLLRPAHQVEGVLGLGRLLAELVTDDFEKGFRHNYTFCLERFVNRPALMVEACGPMPFLLIVAPAADCRKARSAAGRLFQPESYPP